MKTRRVEIFETIRKSKITKSTLRFDPNSLKPTFSKSARRKLLETYNHAWIRFNSSPATKTTEPGELR